MRLSVPALQPLLRSPLRFSSSRFRISARTGLMAIAVADLEHGQRRMLVRVQKRIMAPVCELNGKLLSS